MFLEANEFDQSSPDFNAFENWFAMLNFLANSIKWS